MKLLIKKLHPDAKVPAFALPGDAGLDLYAVAGKTLAPLERAAFPTGLALAVPENHVALVWDKSGIALKSGLKTMGGVLDSGYRGELQVILLNISSDPITIEPGQKIAQLILQRYEQPLIELVEELPTSDRGDRGFGSTGLH